MSVRYIRVADGQTRQRGSEKIFIGGVPNCPPEWERPVCSLCGVEQTFYLQFSLGTIPSWTGKVLSVFACTSCAQSDFLIPEMVSGELNGVNIPNRFLDDYQRNFHVAIFDQNDIFPDMRYAPKIVYSELVEEGASPNNIIGKVGGEPEWILGDESPGTYDGVSLDFLGQLYPNLEFPIYPDTQPQVTLDLWGSPTSSKTGCYELFLGNAVYFFGVQVKDSSKVYVITQVD